MTTVTTSATVTAATTSVTGYSATTSSVTTSPETSSTPLVLGIESTCDETGFALVRGRELLANKVSTSMNQHARYGGIIPEIASRAHLETFIPTLSAMLDEANQKLRSGQFEPEQLGTERAEAANEGKKTAVGRGLDRRLEGECKEATRGSVICPLTLADVDAIAVAAGPGLVGSLTVGICGAKALATALGVPLYGVNHVIGHLAVDSLVHGPLPERFIGLIASGGHSNLLLVENLATEIRELGGTLDDAAGEAFDKVGRLLGLPYPGGPHVDRLAQQGNPQAIRFPRGLSAAKDKERHKYDFSFSGLKTAVSRYLTANPATAETMPDVCAGFSESVNDSLTAKAVQAAQDFDCDTIVVGGGFTANSRLRSLLAKRATDAGLTVRIPPLKLCTDNGAQIAALGSALVEAGLPASPAEFGPDSGMELTQIYMA